MKNDLGVDPHEWFENPLDSMPIAKDPEPILERKEVPPELKETPTSVKNPEIPKPKKKEKTMHETMYEIATARYNPFSLGGSENCDSDISCNIGGSENLT